MDISIWWNNWTVSIASLAMCIFYWWILCLVVANAGGWARQVEKHRATTWPKDGVLKWQFIRVGRCSYPRSTYIAARPEGLYLAVSLFFRPQHPPLLIPWSEFHWHRRVELGIGPMIELVASGMPLPTTIHIPVKLADRIGLHQYLGSVPDAGATTVAA